MAPSAAPPSTDDYDITSGAAMADPYPLYQRLREHAPVYRMQAVDAWIITRYEHVEPLLRDTRLRSYRAGYDQSAQAPPEVREQLKFLNDLHAQRFFKIEPPAHTALRRLFIRSFGPRFVEQLRPRIQSICEELLGEVAARGEMEVIRDLAYPLPAMVIAEMMGVPGCDRHLLQTWSRVLLSYFGTSFGTSEFYSERDAANIEAIYQTHLEMTDYLRDLIAERRERPRDDILSYLVHPDEGAPVLNERELFSNCITLLFAGHETTMNLLGNGLYALLRNTEQHQTLREDPALLPAAIEEMLRYDSPVQFSKRVTASALSVGSTCIPANEELWLCLGAANRDPAQFPEPERFDITRSPNRHVAFGAGIRFCLGSSLARLEATVAFELLLKSLPELRLTTDVVKQRLHPFFRGVEALPVSFRATTGGRHADSSVAS